jgi:DNA-binding transcriptional MerR regulator/AcrR family transcriptional regulator
VTENTASRRLRADAQRNIDSLLEAAKAVFRTSGVDAPAKEIADLAGVGVGTLYRHFPQRSDLIRAVFQRGVDACADAGPALAAAHEPAAALAKWLHRFTEFVATKRGFATALHSGDPAFDALSGYFYQRLEPTLGALLEAATASGEIRADISAKDLLHAVASLCLPAPDGEPEYSQRMVALLIDGLRYGAGTRLRVDSPAAGGSRLAVMRQDDGPLLSIGELAKRTGLPVRTIRFWSDVGVVPPAGRTESGRRLYDAACVARLELAATLRDLGLGLPDVRRVLDGKTTVAEVAAAQLEALDAQARVQQLRRAVLSAVVKRAAGSQQTAMMNKLVRLSAAERKQIIDDFTAEVFDGLEPRLRKVRRWSTGHNLPDDPSPEQIDAWLELAELAADPGFRHCLRQVTCHGIAWQADNGLLSRAQESAEEALERDIAPGSAEAARIVDAILTGTAADQRRGELLTQLEDIIDPRIERYWKLTATINGWPSFESPVPAFEWLMAALEKPPSAADPDHLSRVRAPSGLYITVHFGRDWCTNPG